MPGTESRFSRRIQYVAPAALVGALALGYFLLDTSLPGFRSKFEKIPQNTSEHWSAPIWSLSEAVAGHTTAAIVLIAVVGIAATVVSLLGRPLAFLVYAVAGIVALCDIVLFLGAYTWMLTDALPASQ